MNRPRNELFARPGFPKKNHRGILGGNHFNPVQHILQRLTLADDIFKVMFQFDLFLQVGAFSLQLLL